MSSEFEEASKNYKNAFHYDPNSFTILFNKFSDIKKPAILYGSYSIIPGLGQMLNGKTTKGLVHLGVFSISSFLGYNAIIEADKIYDSYKLASNSYDAETLYNEAEAKRKSSFIYFGISALTIIYSIFDSYTDIIQFNNLFEIGTPNNYSSSLLPSYNYLFKLRIRL